MNCDLLLIALIFILITVASELASEEPVIHIDHRTMDDDTRRWLEKLECKVSPLLLPHVVVSI